MLLKLLQSQFVKEIVVGFSGAFFGAFFAALVAIGGTRLQAQRELNKAYRDELISWERYFKVLCLEINVTNDYLRKTLFSISENSAQRPAMMASYQIASLSEKAAENSSILDIVLLSEAVNVQAIVRHFNRVAENWNLINQETRTFVFANFKDDDALDLYRENMLGLRSSVVTSIVQITILKQRVLTALAMTLTLLSILPSNGWRFYLENFSKYKFSKFMFNTILSKEYDSFFER